MKIYTKTGDQGQTSLFDGQRVKKDQSRLDCYGDLDELNSHVGMAISFLNNVSDFEEKKKLHANWLNIQNTIFNMGSYIATEKTEFIAKLPSLNEELITTIEQDIDIFQSQLTPLKEFILPGGSQLSSQLHICRTVCRRSERKIVGLDADLPNFIYLYLNRLSDYFFVCSRLINLRLKQSEPTWTK